MITDQIRGRNKSLLKEKTSLVHNRSHHSVFFIIGNMVEVFMERIYFRVVKHGLLLLLFCVCVSILLLVLVKGYGHACTSVINFTVDKKKDTTHKK